MIYIDMQSPLTDLDLTCVWLSAHIHSIWAGTIAWTLPTTPCGRWLRSHALLRNGRWMRRWRTLERPLGLTATRSIWHLMRGVCRRHSSAGCLSTHSGQHDITLLWAIPLDSSNCPWLLAGVFTNLTRAFIARRRYLYEASSLCVIPHLPPDVTALEQKLPVRWGHYQIFISTTGSRTHGITAVALNGKPLPLSHAGSGGSSFNRTVVVLEYDALPAPLVGDHV